MHIPAVCRLVGQLSPMGYKHDYRNAVEMFTQNIKNNPDYFLWVAMIHNRVVGTVMMHLQHKLSYHCGTAAHVEDLVVDESCRGGLVGDKLLRHAIQTAKDWGCYKIMLTCWDKSVGYFERFGFQDNGHDMRMNLKENLYENES